MKIKTFIDHEQERKNVKANFWWMSVPKILENIAKTINKIKDVLKDDPAFQTSSLPRLRQLWKELKTISATNKETLNNSGVIKEMELVNEINELINIWYEQSGIAVGIKKYSNRSYYGQVAVVDNYLYLSGPVKEYKFLKAF